MTWRQYFGRHIHKFWAMLWRLLVALMFAIFCFRPNVSAGYLMAFAVIGLLSLYGSVAVIGELVKERNSRRPLVFTYLFGVAVIFSLTILMMENSYLGWYYKALLLPLVVFVNVVYVMAISLFIYDKAYLVIKEAPN